MKTKTNSHNHYVSRCINLLVLPFILMLGVLFITGCKEDDNNKPTGPVIASVSPARALPGETVNILGSNFGTETSKVRVNFGTEAGSIISVTSTQIAVEVPEAEEGVIELSVVINELTSNTLQFEVLSKDAPSIESLSPVSGVVGETIEINGRNFGTVTEGVEVLFGTTAAVIGSVADDLISVTVPDLDTGIVAVSIRVDELTSTEVDFRVLGPIVEQVSPISVVTGANVTITGTNFDPIAENNVVMFGDTQLPVNEATENTLQVTVPSGLEGTFDVSVSAYSQTYTLENAITVIAAVQPIFWVEVDANSTYYLMQGAKGIEGDSTGLVLHQIENADQMKLVNFYSISYEEATNTLYWSEFVFDFNEFTLVSAIKKKVLSESNDSPIEIVVSNTDLDTYYYYYNLTTDGNGNIYWTQGGADIWYANTSGGDEVELYNGTNEANTGLGDTISSIIDLDYYDGQLYFIESGEKPQGNTTSIFRRIRRANADGSGAIEALYLEEEFSDNANLKSIAMGDDKIYVAMSGNSAASSTIRSANSERDVTSVATIYSNTDESLTGLSSIAYDSDENYLYWYSYLTISQKATIYRGSASGGGSSELIFNVSPLDNPYFEIGSPVGRQSIPFKPFKPIFTAF